MKKHSIVIMGMGELGQALAKLLKSKADEQGHYTLESIWTAWKDWEFGQKREPSRWLTLQAWTIIKRMEPSAY